MEIAEQWLDAQRATPSFVSTFEGNIQSILDAPLPASLRDTPRTTHSPRVGAATPPPRYTGGASRYIEDDFDGRPVHDKLMDRGRVYQQRKEALQQKYMEADMSKLRDKPKVSEAAKQLNRDKNVPFHERIKKNVDARQRQLQHAQEIRLQKENEEFERVATFKPHLNSKSKRASSRISAPETNEQWQRRREQKLDTQRSERIMKEMAEVRDAPDISMRSHRLATKRREREGMAGVSHVEAMLEHDRLSRLALWERQQEELATTVQNPKITMYAATMDRGGDAGERLYAESIKAEERRAARIRASLMESAGSKGTPRITKVAGSVARAQPVEDELMQRHLDSLAEREAEQRREAERERFVHTPAINPVSDAIASRLPNSTRERLYAPSQRSQRRDPSSAAMRGASPTPSRSRGGSRSASAASSTASSTGGPSASFFARLNKDEERRRDRQKEATEAARQREDDGCTFAPVTTPRADRAAQRGAGVHERVAQWAKKRQLRLDEQRAAREDNELQGCTFVPDTHQSPSQRRESRLTYEAPAETIYGGDGTPWGTNEYVQRLEEARRRQFESTARQSTPTSNWRPGTTETKEFNLGRNRTPVRSLKKPIVGPSSGPTFGTASPAEREAAARASSPGYVREGSAASANIPAAGQFSAYGYTGTTGGVPIVPPSMR